MAHYLMRKYDGAIRAFADSLAIAAHMKKHRMEAAASMLIKTQKEIAAIAQAVGYESQSRFTAAFKETYGQLPTEYRKERQKQ